MGGKQPEFVPIPGRDASAAIRGYVYQVDVTILRWLSLVEGEELQLECGEDIDRIQKEVMGGKFDIQRILEQVKHRGRPLKLNSPEALDALVSYCEHRRNNPGLRIGFVYLTNSKVGREYRSSLPDGEPAIIAWQRLRRLEMVDDGVTETLCGIRGILTSAGKPTKVNELKWAAFQKFIRESEDQALFNFIRSFTWNVEAPSASQMPEDIRAEILRTGRASSKEATDSMYARLFVFVVRRLADRGPKILTTHELNLEVSRLNEEPVNKQLIDTVRTLIGSVDNRLRSLEETRTQDRKLLKELEANLSLLTQQSGFQGIVDYNSLTIPLDIPPSVEPSTKRDDTVANFVEMLKGKVWCALNGEICSGKTQLAILIVGALQRPVIWIRLRGLSVEQSCLRLDGALAQASGNHPTAEFRAWYARACQIFGGGVVIVLDDLPNDSLSSDFNDRLMLLAEACDKNGCTLITTSNEELPPSVKDRAGAALVSANIPLFNEEEVRELFLAYGCPPRLLNNKFVTFLWSLTRGHPLLLNALARNIAGSSWRISDKQLQKLFRGDYADDLRPHTRKLLSTTIKDPESRDLLFRLNMAGFSFGDEHVRLVSEVAPPINRPIEKLTLALGLWVQRDSSSKYSISPLLSNIGSPDLSSSVQNDVHEALGLNIMSKGKLGPLDVLNAFHHFTASRQFERAALVLVLALSEMARMDKPISHDWLISTIWADVPLPEEIDLGMRLYLRSQQIIVRRHLKKDVRYLLEDFDSLLIDAPQDAAFGIVGGCIMLAWELAGKEPARANRYLLRGIKAIPTFLLPDGSRPEIPSDARPEFLFVRTGLCIRSKSDLNDWISSMEELGTPAVRRVFNSRFGEDGSKELCDHIWLEEDKKSPELQNWDGILEQLATLGEFAKRHGTDILQVCSLRAQIVVLCEYKKEFAKAFGLAKHAISEFGGKPGSAFLIQETVGREFLYAKRWKESLQWLDDAVRQKSTSYPLVRMQALLAASEAAGHNDPSMSIRYCERAVEVAVNNEEIPELQVVVALGEKAIAFWQAGNRLAAYETLEAAAERLLSVQVEDDTWKKLFMICAVVSSYFMSMASVGKAPDSISEDEAPGQGMFLRNYPEASQRYDPKRKWVLAGQLAIFAKALERDEDTARWALRAVEYGRGGWREEISGTLRLYAIWQAILEDRYGEALQMALDVSTVMAAEGAKWQSSQAYADLPASATTAPENGGTATPRVQVETNAANIALIPIIFRLATLWLNDPGGAREAADAVAIECRGLAETSENQHLWTGAAKLVTGIFEKNASWQQLLEQGNEFARNNRPTLHIICYAGASLHARPREALRLQLVILPTLEYQWSHFGTFRRIAVPFVFDYWKEKIERSAYYFGAPFLLKERLKSISKDKPEARLRQLLTEIAFSTGLKLSESERLWLKS